MKPIQRTRNFIIAAFLLSLLFHASSVLYVVIQRTHQPNQNELSEQDELHNPTINKKDKWVETKARASNFGAPVMFEDIPQEDDTPQENAVEPNLIEQTEQKIIEEIVSEKIMFKEKNVSENKPKVKQPLQANKPLPKKRQNRPIRQKKVTAAPRPPLSLAQLTQGFLNHIKDEGKHAVHMLGKKSGTPSDEQIKYERYLQKLNWCFQNSLITSNTHLTISEPIDTEIHIFFALNQDGSIRHLQLSKSSKNRELDELYLSTFRDASTSFPPVPHYLPHDPFAMTCIIPLHVRQANNIRLYAR